VKEGGNYGGGGGGDSTEDGSGFIDCDISSDEDSSRGFLGSDAV